MKSFLIIFGTTVIIAGAVVVPFKHCPNARNDSCTIHQLRINPCPQADKGQMCLIERGVPTSFQFDFTTNFHARYLQLDAEIFWEDAPFRVISTYPCSYMICPVKANIKQTYKMDLFQGRKLPSLAYNVTWKLWNIMQPEQECCFTFPIKVRPQYWWRNIKWG